MFMILKAFFARKTIIYIDCFLFSIVRNFTILLHIFYKQLIIKILYKTKPKKWTTKPIF